MDRLIENYFPIFYLNIRSLSIVEITETNGYRALPITYTMTGTFVYKHRSFKSGGGVGLYLSKLIVLIYKNRDDVSVLNDEVMETLFIEILRPH